MENKKPKQVNPNTAPPHEFLKYVEELETYVNKLEQQLRLYGVVRSSVQKDTLIEDLNDKRIVGKTIDEHIWHYCRKETAEHLLDKYDIRLK